jgi:cation-transporting ATPase 13A3/4/5
LKIEVGMCGDGANDCAALKAADIGISISQTEASIAAPFTSQIENIKCVTLLLREGRCALATLANIFKFFEMYTMTEFTMVILLYTAGSTLSDNQYAFLDFLIGLPVGLFLGWITPSNKLSVIRPTSSLLIPPFLMSIFGFIAL